MLRAMGRMVSGTVLDVSVIFVLGSRIGLTLCAHVREAVVHEADGHVARVLAGELVLDFVCLVVALGGVDGVLVLALAGGRRGGCRGRWRRRGAAICGRGDPCWCALLGLLLDLVPPLGHQFCGKLGERGVLVRAQAVDGHADLGGAQHILGRVDAALQLVQHLDDDGAGCVLLDGFADVFSPQLDLLGVHGHVCLYWWGAQEVETRLGGKSCKMARDRFCLLSARLELLVAWELSQGKAMSC